MVDIESEVEQLKAEIKTLKSKQEEKDDKISKLECEKAQLVTEVREALGQQKLQEVVRVETQKQKLKHEIEMLEEKDAHLAARHEKNIVEIKSKKAALESIQEELQAKHGEVEQLRQESETVKDQHAKEIKNLQAKHDQEITQIQDEKKHNEKKKESEAKKLIEKLQEKEEVSRQQAGEIELWRRKSEQVEEVVAQLHKKMEDEKTCALPPEHHLEEIKRLKAELEGMHVQHKEEVALPPDHHTEEIKQLKAEAEKVRIKCDEVAQLKARLEEKEKTEAQGNLEKVDRLHHEQVETNKKHAEDIRRLQSELKLKDEQHAKEMTQMKTEFERRFREEEKLRGVEVQRKVSCQDAAASGRLRELRNETEGLKKDAVEKDKTINELSEQLKKAREERDQKEHEKNKCVEVTKSNSERIQHDLKQRHLAEASRRQKEHDKQLKDKDTEIKTLTEQLRLATVREVTLSEAKDEPEITRKLRHELRDKDDQLHEKDAQLKLVVDEVVTLQGTYAQLVAEHEQLHNQVKVDAIMRKELAATNDCSSLEEPCSAVDTEPQVHAHCMITF